MPEGKRDFRWMALGQSVRGVSHVRGGLPNQDDVKFHACSDGAPPIVLAVSDGHGSPKSFRSSTGAQIATGRAVELTLKFLAGMKGSPLAAVKNTAETLLTADIVKSWTDDVRKDAERNPFSTEELDRLEKEAGASAKHAALGAGGHLMAYGATLLLIAISDSFLFYLQLGDGDILAVSDRTQEVEHPLPSDASLIANETTSLCMDNAQKMFRFRFQYIHEFAPAIILASTDGYSNSFSSESGFRKVGSDLLQILKTDGPENVKASLPTWLNDASKAGSGDDVTLGLIYQMDAIANEPGKDPQATTTELRADLPATLPAESVVPTAATELEADEHGDADAQPAPG